MCGVLPESMAVALDEIAFLANSANRVAALQALTEAPRTRYELEDALGISRATVGRILHDFEANAWIQRTGQTYESTPIGAWVCTAFTRLLRVMETECRLRGVLPWFPIDAVGFDIEWLRGAEIVRPTQSNPMAPIDRAVELLRTGTHVRILTTQVVAAFFDLLRKGVVYGDTTQEGVATPEVYETIMNDPELAAAFQDMCQVETTAFFIAADVPLILHIVDEKVLIGLIDDEGTPRAAIISDNDTVYAWAVKTFETYRAKSEPVEFDTFAP